MVPTFLVNGQKGVCIGMWHTPTGPPGVLSYNDVFRCVVLRQLQHYTVIWTRLVRRFEIIVHH